MTSDGDKVERKDFMTPSQKSAMGNLPRTHANCMEKTKVARPGKTAHDKWKRGHGRQNDMAQDE